MCYTGVKKSPKKGNRMKNYFPVNDLAPQGEALTVYVKKVPEKKSDGFAVVENGSKIYDFGPVSWFWIAASIISFVVPVLNWKKMTTTTK